jgi:hypothetical protein
VAAQACPVGRTGHHPVGHELLHRKIVGLLTEHLAQGRLIEARDAVLRRSGGTPRVWRPHDWQP